MILPAPILRILLYVGDPRQVADSYVRNFDFVAAPRKHTIDDIEGFQRESLRKGLKFGKTFQGEGYEFANARDPAKNPIQISRRAFLK